MSPRWHTKNELLRVVRDELGHCEKVQDTYLEMEPLVAQLWEAGEHDYSWYSSPFYAYESVNCFNLFTKGAARWFARWINENAAFYSRRLDTVLDYGCGVAASARLFTELTSPQRGVIAQYYGQPLADVEPVQMRVGRRVCAGVEGVTHVACLEPGELHGSWQGVMAFELFEHEQRPLDTWDQLTEDVETWIVCEASSFTASDKYGHHEVYDVGGDPVPRRAMSRRWRRELEARGWRLADTGWNARPKVWVR